MTKPVWTYETRLTHDFPKQDKLTNTLATHMEQHCKFWNTNQILGLAKFVWSCSETLKILGHKLFT